MSIRTKHSPADCEVCAAQQEADALGATPTAGHPNKQNETPRLITGQKVTWLQQRKWGGKQNVPATFQCMARNGLSRTSAVIKIDGNGEKTVRLTSLRFEVKTNAD